MAGAAAAIAVLLVVAPSSEAQVKKQSGQVTKLNAVSKTNLPKVTKKPHRLILQVNSNEPAMINNTRENMGMVICHSQALPSSRILPIACPS